MESGHIFLSYARRDGGHYVGRLEQDLTSAGYKTWRDKRSLNEFNDFSAEIETGIRSASCVAVCITPSVEQNPSSFVRREIIYAQTKNKPIIPLVFPDAELPVLINHLTWIPFFEGSELRYEAGLEELLRRLGTSLKPSPQQTNESDLFRPYLTQLYEWIISYLDQSVSSLITIGSVPDSDAVQSTGESNQLLPTVFLNTFALGAGIHEIETSQPHHYQNFPEAFEMYKGRVLLLGEPGSGKTTTLMAFTRDAVVARLENPDAPLPILAPISSWDIYAQPSIEEWVSDGFPSLKNDIYETIQDGRALLLLDGLDELGSERPVNPEQLDGETFDPRQVFIRKIPEQNQVLLTCRTKDYQGIQEKVLLNGAVRLQPLNDEQISKYLEHQPELWSILQRDAQLKELTRTPLLLSLLTFAFSDAAIDLSALQGLKAGELTDKIFEMYLYRRFEYEQRKPFAELPYSYEKVVGILRCVARMDLMGESQNAVQQLYVNQCLGYEPDLFIEQACRLHIFVTTVDSNVYRFIHPLLRDYLAFPDLLKSLNEKYEWWRRRKASSVLGELRDIRAVEPLIKCLLDDKDENIRGAAADALGKIGDPVGIPALILALEDNRARVRGRAAQALGIMGDVRAVTGLLSLTQDGDKTIRQIALNAISQVRSPDAVTALVQGLDNANPAVIQAVSTALVQIGEPALPALLDCLRSKQEKLRHGAAIILGQRQAVEAVPDLIKLLADETPVSLVQRMCDIAAEALQAIGTPEAMTAVTRWRQES